jgi:hypothetical protein
MSTRGQSAEATSRSLAGGRQFLLEEGDNIDLEPWVREDVEEDIVEEMEDQNALVHCSLGNIFMSVGGRGLDYDFDLVTWLETVLIIRLWRGDERVHPIFFSFHLCGTRFMCIVSYIIEAYKRRQRKLDELILEMRGFMVMSSPSNDKWQLERVCT